MNEDFQYIIETNEPVQKNHFPIVAQLSVLGFILIGLFGVLLIPHTKPEALPAAVEPSTTLDAPEHPIVPQKIEGVSVRAEAAYVWDVRGQRALYSKNADESLPLASITKLMTALLAYELVEDEKRATIELSAIQQEGSSGFSAGEQLRIDKLREIALVSSSNDAAFALAASVGTLLGDNDPAAQFIRGMNIRAQELGFTTLDFKSTTGLDLSPTTPGATGSARDISFLMEHIVINYPEIIAPTKASSARVFNTAGLYHDINNTNEIALEIPNMIGSKTGYTDLAGGNLTIAFDAGLNRPIIVTVLGSTREERFTDVLKLVKAVQESVSRTE